MTPERIEEIKDMYEEGIMFSHPTGQTSARVVIGDLRAALEEAQQALHSKNNLIMALEGVKSKLHYELVEAQQTIARQQQVWQELKDIVSTNATGGRGEDINDYDIMLNIIGDLEGEKTDEGHDNA
jgi:hypothetical protein